MDVLGKVFPIIIDVIDDKAVSYFIEKGIECGRMDNSARSYSVLETLLQMPSFEYEANSVCVTIRREQFAQNIGKSGQKVARKRLEKWPETKQIIISVIEANPTATISLLEQQTGKGHTTVKKYIKQLQEEGFLTRIGPDKSGYWKVNDKVN